LHYFHALQLDFIKELLIGFVYMAFKNSRLFYPPKPRPVIPSKHTSASKPSILCPRVSKTIEKHDVFRERAMGGVSWFYSHEDTGLSPGTIF